MSCLGDTLQEARATEHPLQLHTGGSGRAFASLHPHSKASVHNRAVSYLLFTPGEVMHEEHEKTPQDAFYPYITTWTSLLLN